jgi:hypothetical protein
MKSLVRRTVGCAAAALTIVSAVAPPAMATHKPSHKTHHHKLPQVTVHRHRAYASNVWLLKLKVSDFRFDPVVGHNRMDGPRETLSNMSKRTHALAGINTDAFYWTPHTPPRGGFVRNGVVDKTQNNNHEANLYFTSNGRAYIGRAPYKITANGRRITALNDVHAIYDRRLTELTPAHMSTALPKGCEVVTLAAATKKVHHKTVHGYTVASVDKTKHFTALHKAGNRAIVACRSSDLTWVKNNMHKHAWVNLKFAWHVPGLGKAHITALASGVSVLVRAGKRYHDPSRYFRPVGRNPETIACVSRDHKQVMLGIMDGRSTKSAGLSYDQVRAYMLKQNCWTGMAFDGGGSTEMVVHNKILNHPSDGHQRTVPSGLFVYRKPTK